MTTDWSGQSLPKIKCFFKLQELAKLSTSNEYFYQVGLTDFGNFGTIRFDPPLNIRSLLTIAASHERDIVTVPTDTSDMEVDNVESFDWEEAISKVEKQLISRREMLREYFSLDISPKGDLMSIPLLMKGYTPSLAKLPRFLLRLGPYVDWINEKDCFRSFLTELAAFYVPESVPAKPSPSSDQTAEEDADSESRRTQLNRALEHSMFPSFRSRLVATKGLLNGVVEVANLKGLYRVFERC